MAKKVVRSARQLTTSRVGLKNAVKQTNVAAVNGKKGKKNGKQKVSAA